MRCSGAISWAACFCCLYTAPVLDSVCFLHSVLRSACSVAPSSSFFLWAFYAVFSKRKTFLAPLYEIIIYKMVLIWPPIVITETKIDVKGVELYVVLLTAHHLVGIALLYFRARFVLS